MANKTIRYELIGGCVERYPTDATGTGTLRFLVKTKVGSYHTLLVATDVHTAKRFRAAFNELCSAFKECAASLWRSL
jgi:hypothetical protein